MFNRHEAFGGTGGAGLPHGARAAQRSGAAEDRARRPRLPVLLTNHVVAPGKRQSPLLAAQNALNNDKAPSLIALPRRCQGMGRRRWRPGTNTFPAPNKASRSVKANQHQCVAGRHKPGEGQTHAMAGAARFAFLRPPGSPWAPVSHNLRAAKNERFASAKRLRSAGAGRWARRNRARATDRTHLPRTVLDDENWFLGSGICTVSACARRSIAPKTVVVAESGGGRYRESVEINRPRASNDRRLAQTSEQHISDICSLFFFHSKPGGRSRTLERFRFAQSSSNHRLAIFAPKWCDGRCFGTNQKMVCFVMIIA